MKAFRHCPECGEGIEVFRGMMMGGPPEDRRIHKWNMDVRQCPNDKCEGDLIESGYIAWIAYTLFNKEKKKKVQRAKDIYSDGEQKYVPITDWD